MIIFYLREDIDTKKEKEPLANLACGSFSGLINPPCNFKTKKKCCFKYKKKGVSCKRCPNADKLFMSKNSYTFK